jgi:hypothetical protein
MKKYLPSPFYLLALYLLVLPPTLLLAQKSSLNVINVTPVDENGNLLNNFNRGEYIRVDWSGYYNKTTPNDKAFNGSLSLTASYQVILFGKKINYSIKLPVSGAGAGLKSIVNSSTDTDILNQNQDYREFTDYLIPNELPAGKLTITLTGNANNKNVSPLSFKKTIDLK